MNVEQLFSQLWHDYTEITPQAEQIKQLFAATDGIVINDHVAFRTFADTPLQLDNLEPLLLTLGYERQDGYQFEAKKLRAYSFIHPDSNIPKIFCSELLTDQLSRKSQEIIARYTQQIKPQELDLSVFWSARHWDMPSWDDYQSLMMETEYGAWLLAIGIRVNHFTVSVNHLSSTDSLGEVLQRVKSANFNINSVGGEIKGSPESLLEQGSTMADRLALAFADGDVHEIPTCFYEFALRHEDIGNELYQGFVAANADKIFESTSAA
ncbi:DUF1338 domain-containing protein [Amphritea balenae]|uniref:2-oxoadipate dioxygenase/decarboxylase n=1 Tax=Amphritea balenae TaxID=452629 RepID=A0A3P1SX93_9GAMM|nr:DUF1338 domain-containing protein [Amphritea balenae]RRD01760.1 DUF1338 domain-containing protein [Amphritea balenae]GGK54267.1 DUF1338 domain-containing protein [Amphritea balenae]